MVSKINSLSKQQCLWALRMLGTFFKKMMDKLLGYLSGKGIEVYLDGLVIYSKTKSKHEELIREVFNRLQRNNLYIVISSTLSPFWGKIYLKILHYEYPWYSRAAIK